jgi:hypothetical protein
MKKHATVLIVVLCLIHQGFSQPPDYVSGATNVTFSCKTLALSSDLPFDNPFVLIVNDVPTKSMTAKLFFTEGANLNSAKFIKDYNRFGDSFYMIFDFSEFYESNVKGKFLSPGKTYSFRLIFCDSTGREMKGSQIDRSTMTRTKLSDYVKLDFGFAYSPHIVGVFGFTSAHFYLTAINQDADLGKIKGFKRQVALRTSFFIGISPFTIYSDTKQPIDKPSGAGNFIYGIGFRSPLYGYSYGNWVARTFFQPMRVVAGNMVFMQKDANPLITQNHIKQSFYIGISFDINIATLLTPISKLYIP